MKTRLKQLGLVLLTLVGVSLTTPIAIAVELAEIQKRGTLIVAVKDNVRPLGFRDDTGELQGLEIQLAYQLAEALLGDRTAITFVPVRNDERLEQLLTEEVDLVIAQMSATKMRSRLVQFSRPYYFERTGFITRNPQIQTYGDLAQLRIAMLQGSSAIASVRRTFPEATLVGVESYQAAATQLEAGIVDVFAGDRAVLTGWVQDEPDYFLADAEISLGGAPLAVAIPKGQQHSELFLAVNATLQALKESGWLNAQYLLWGLAE